MVKKFTPVWIQETETGMVRACHTPQQPLQNHSSGHLGGWVVGRGNAGWTTSKSGHSCWCQNCLQGPPTEETGRGSLLNYPSCPPDDPIGPGTELNCKFKVTGIALVYTEDIMGSYTCEHFQAEHGILCVHFAFFGTDVNCAQLTSWIGVNTAGIPLYVICHLEHKVWSGSVEDRWLVWSDYDIKLPIQVWSR